MMEHRQLEFYRGAGQRQAGFGLPMALFVIVVLALLAISITELERTTGEGVAISVQSTRAFYAAESGAQLALNELFPPGGTTTNCAALTSTHTFSTNGLNSCQASVACLTDNVGGVDYFTVRSTGSCGTAADGAQRTVEVRAY